ncbi:MAG TPA: ABC transporter permease [Ilumatobacteraceae bacterium]|nr:ABC transporter permease [Ilumatobacteraceae bacterium]
MFDQLFDAALLDSVVRATVPILIAALGGLICERAGVFQISLEGTMLVGAFTAVSVSYASGNAYLGVLAAIVAGVAVSQILAYGCITRRGDPIVIGIAINLLAVGLTGFLLPQFFDVRGVFKSADIAGLHRYAIPLLSDIPVVGKSLFRMTIPAYLAFLLVPVIWVMLFRTPLGLRLRGVGERPHAAATRGVPVTGYQYAAVATSGALAGLAGAQLAIGNVVQFAEGMSSGRGWIAVVAVLLGGAHPYGVLAACSLFGLAEGLGFRLQGNGLAVQITDALPWIVTLVALLLARKQFARLIDLTGRTS